MRTNFSARGRGISKIRLPQYFVTGDGVSPVDAAQTSIERLNKPLKVYSVRADGVSSAPGGGWYEHYAYTIGVPRDGGCDVTAEITITFQPQ
jgi:hypothetical protein